MATINWEHPRECGVFLWVRHSQPCTSTRQKTHPSQKAPLERVKQPKNDTPNPNLCLTVWAGGQGSVPHGTAEEKPPRPCGPPCPSVLPRLQVRQKVTDLKTGTQTCARAQGSRQTDTQRAYRQALFAAPELRGWKLL